VVFTPSPGGVASGLASYLASLGKKDAASEYLWFGWPGTVVKNELKDKVIKEANKHQTYPVFLDKQELDGFYNGFSNKTLWPLFHYFTSLVEYNEDNWQAYQAVNRHYADVIAPRVTASDLIIVHDYQLLLLPGYLRSLKKDLSIGFFLHIPFPSYEIFRLLPTLWREALLQGIIGADVVGFHTYEYQQHFLTSTMRLLGVEHKMGRIDLGERVVKMGTFPFGVDYDKFHQAAKLPAIAKNVASLRQTFQGQKSIFSVDRLDYTKGIANRLLGYERFLKDHPEWHEKVVLIVSSEPSRTDVDQYQQMKRKIDELVGKINGSFGTLSWSPIVYQFTSLSFEGILALFNVSDVALVTPLRDGMNLIAKEFVASRQAPGVLILSEMAGAVKELREAIQINPYDISNIALGIQQALTMPLQEQEARLQAMQARLKTYTITRWAEDMHKALLSARKDRQKKQGRLITRKTQEQLLREYQHSERRLILLDYDGTLVPFTPTPPEAVPDKRTLSLLKRLSDDHKNEVVIISGRDRGILETWFHLPKVSLVAEHGVWKRERQEYYWELLHKFRKDWKKEVLLFLRQWVTRVPVSLIEEKEYSLAWHYRLVEADIAQWAVKELLYELHGLTATIDVEVVHGNKAIEIKSVGANKSAAAQSWLVKKNYDFILALGDDTTDEDVFLTLPQRAYSIKVGQGATAAKYRVTSFVKAHQLLGSLAETLQTEEIDEKQVRLPQLV